MKREELEAIISSGILENFVLGATTPEEDSYVLDLKSKYPEIAAELLKLELTLEEVVQKQSTEVPAALREAIYNKTVGNSADPQSIEKTLSTQSPPSYFKSLSLVLGLLSVITIAFALYMHRSSKQVQNELDNTQQDLAIIKDNCDDTIAALSILSDPKTEKIKLASTKDDPSVLAFIWYNEDLDQVIFNGNNLPEINEALSYQLWAIIDGVPSDMGVLEWNKDNKIVKVSFKGKPQAFAITIEPAGGSQNPTLDQLIVLGEVNAS